MVPVGPPACVRHTQHSVSWPHTSGELHRKPQWHRPHDASPPPINHGTTLTRFVAQPFQIFYTTLENWVLRQDNTAFRGPMGSSTGSPSGSARMRLPHPSITARPSRVSWPNHFRCSTLLEKLGSFAKIMLCFSLCGSYNSLRSQVPGSSSIQRLLPRRSSTGKEPPNKTPRGSASSSS